MAGSASADSCRICLQDSSDEVLLSPCVGCRGSSAFVHATCAERFFKTKKTWWDLSCPTCKHNYEGDLVLTLGRIGLANLRRVRDKDRQAARIRDTAIANVLSVMGSAYGSKGKLQKERKMLEDALQATTRAYSAQHPETAKALSNLGNVVGRLGDARRQRSLLQKALKIHERVHGPQHPEVAMFLTNLASAYGRLNDTPKMCSILERALAIFERSPGSAQVHFAVALIHLGIAKGKLGDHVRKRELLQRALPLQERQFGAEHKKVGDVLWHLGSALLELKETALARPLLERAAAIKEHHLGSRNVELGAAWAALALACGRLGDGVMERKYAERAVTVLAGPDIQAARSVLSGVAAEELSALLPELLAEAFAPRSDDSSTRVIRRKPVRAPGSVTSSVNRSICAARKRPASVSAQSRCVRRRPAAR